MDNPTNGDAGVLALLVDDVLYLMNDTWTGTNITSSMYFTIQRTDDDPQNAVHQATFDLIRKLRRSHSWPAAFQPSFC